KKALDYRENNTVTNKTLNDLVKTIEEKKGFVRSGWCGSQECEAEVKEKTAATIRVIDDKKESGIDKCLVCGKDSTDTVIFAKSY
ncbi:MAG: proline--tRNA ligase, partial [Candidatus Aminicenantes bacterium]|nr:proline--tRNA ligase [Candidatus Aminicenantes bacterium]